MDKALFFEACDLILSRDRETARQGGIGTLGEKTLHAVLKHYCEPDRRRHEIPVSGFVADIVSDSGIIEIQTRQFSKLRRKLECFLAQTDVTVVYPVARTKWLLWIDEATGAVTKKRKSPKVGQPHEALYELYQIRSLLTHPGLTLRIVLLELEEYRYLDGWSKDKKKGSTRCDRIPVDISGEVLLQSPADYAGLIPAALGGSFTVKDFKTASGLSLYASGLGLSVLNTVGAVVRTGKKGNAYVYERAGGGA